MALDISMTAMTNQATPSSQTDADPTTVTTGVPGLDDIPGGGLVKRGLWLIESTAGAGKTILSAQDAGTRT
jgi:circadian clock protein KaiC